jgi:hypothetical protein
MIQINSKLVERVELHQLRENDILTIIREDGEKREFVILANKEEEDLADETARARRRRKSLRFKGVNWKYTLIRGYDSAACVFGI